MNTSNLKHSFFIVLFLPVLCLAVSCSNKHHIVSGTVEGMNDVKIILSAYYGSSLQIIDSTFSKNGKFSIELPASLKKGMLNIEMATSPSKSIDIIYNNEDIEFITTTDSLITAMQFLRSNENRFFYSFYPLTIAIRDMMMLGDRLNAENPIENKSKLIELNNYIDELESQAYSLFESVAEADKELFAYKVIQAGMYPNYDLHLKNGGTPYLNAYEFMKIHFFDNIDFSEAGLIRTPLLYNAVNDFLINYIFPPHANEYKKAVDMILAKASVNDDVFDYISQLLVHTFESSEFLDVYVYIMDTYLQERICNDEGIYTEELKLYEIIKKSIPGAEIPDIQGQFLNGDVFRIHDFANGATILLFWSPECIHCKDIISYLKEMITQMQDVDIEVVAFAITNTNEEWKQAVIANNMSEWINVSDLAGNQSKVFEQIHIRGTPELYVLSANVIVSRPQNSDSLNESLDFLHDN